MNDVLIKMGNLDTKTHIHGKHHAKMKAQIGMKCV